MKFEFYRNKMTVVSVGELASRLRETTCDINRALKLLEKRGLAEPADAPLLWILHVAELDLRARG